jgi:uncharacterized protein YfkK (UPF0435 family)|tara:strand:- start:233 stop:382 length:150 start_codon:yes stop_codon:yes gene_type:complete
MSKNKKESNSDFDQELNEITELFSSGIINHKKLDNLTSEELRQITDIFK